MNVTHIQICSRNAEGGIVDHATFPILKPQRTSPYFLKNMSGLGPGEILKTYNDGWHYYRLRPKERVVMFLIKMNPSFSGGDSIGDLRDKVYKMISYNTIATDYNRDNLLEIRFLSGNDGLPGQYIASLFGTVTRAESNMFSDEPDLELTLDCPDPFLRKTTRRNMATDISLSVTSESHIVINNPVFLGSRMKYNDKYSTAPHGFKMKIYCNQSPTIAVDAPKQLIIWDARAPDKYRFAMAYDFLPGDVVVISTEENDRYVRIERFLWGQWTLINNIYWGSIWPFIWPGENTIETNKGFQIFEASHADSYWGV